MQSPPRYPSSPDDRLLDATERCIARVGLGKTTVDDVAREARCSRATVYRHFDGRDALVATLVAREGSRLQERVVAAGRAATDLRLAVIAVVEETLAWYRESRALRFVMQHEPELVLPHVSFDGCSVLLARSSETLRLALEPHALAADVERFGEWLTRIVLSYTLSPSEHVDLEDRASLGALVDDFLLPALVPPSTPAPSEVLA